MTYRDLLLKLLARRNTLNVFEDALLGDFSYSKNPKQECIRWCREHNISLSFNENSRLVTLQANFVTDQKLSR